MKGYSLMDTPVLVAGLFMVAVCVFVGFLILTSFTGTALDGEILQNAIIGYMIFDYMPIAITVAFAVGAFISAFYLETHPIFFPVFTIITVILVIFNAALANAFIEFADSPEIVNATTAFPLTVQFFQNLPFIMIVVALVIIIGMYAFKKREQGGNRGV